MNSSAYFNFGLSELAGLFFAALFVEGLFPLQGIALLFVVPYFIVLIKVGVEKPSINIAIFPLLAISLYYCFFMVRSLDVVDFSEKMQILYFYCMLAFFVLGGVQTDSLRFLRAFWACLIPMALFASLIGVFKVILQEQGYVLFGLVDIYNVFSISYPYGSSLRSDYNLFSLSLLVALVGVIAAFLKAEGGLRLGWGLQIALLLLAVYLSGSRRAYGLLMLVVVWGAWVSACCYGWLSFLRYITVMLLLAFFTVFFSESILSGKVYDNYERFPSNLFVEERGQESRDVSPLEGGAAVDQEQAVSDLYEDRQSTSSSYQGKVITYTPGRLASTIVLDNSLGLTSRLDRWGFAIELLRTRWVLGQGFSYRTDFSCEFVSCAYPDYPHNVFLSEFLLAGLVGLSLSLTAALLLLFLVLKSRSELWSSGAGVVMLIALPTLLISGDGVFSISQVVAGFFFAFLFLQKKHRIDLPSFHVPGIKK